MEMEEEERGEFAAIDCLPFDCLVCICEYLSPRDLCRFGAACRLFHEASLVGYLWRHHCLTRWTFCDIFQIPKGKHRWRRYFLARRKVDASMDSGRPVRDYKVKTLRGHQSRIVAAEVVGGRSVDWEDPKPPLVVSLSEDSTVKAWDVLQGKPVWSREGDVRSISVASMSEEVAVGLNDGRVLLLDSSTWTERAACQVVSNRQPVTFMKYGRIKQSNLPNPFLMILCETEEDSRHTEVWGTGSAGDPAPSGAADGSPSAAAGGTPWRLFSLWTPHHALHALQLCEATGLLAIPNILTGEVNVWSLSAISADSPSTPPIHPHLTLCTNSSNCVPYWVSPGLLATRGDDDDNSGGAMIRAPGTWMPVSRKIRLWDVLGEIKRAGTAPRVPDTTSGRVYNSLRTITCHAPPTSLSAAGNGVLVVGELDGTVELFDARAGAKTRGDGEDGEGVQRSAVAVVVDRCLQTFSDHKGAVTHMYADKFRVLTCSKDFSIRVYRWKKPEAGGIATGGVATNAGSEEKKAVAWSGVTLESRYTLLGGSVAMKTHDGFSRVLCEAGNCIGVAGNDLKFYNFSCKFENT